MLLLFPYFPSESENTCSKFSRKLFNQFEKCLRIMIKALEFYNKCSAGMDVAAQGGTCVTWKTQRETLCTAVFKRFSPSFHQNDLTVSGHLILVTDDLENVG